ncbi:MAG: TolC family protein [Pseudomonadota bacterium]
MKINRLRSAWITVLGVAGALPVFAMPIDEAVSAALASDQRLAAGESMIASGEASVTQARSAYLPTVTLDAAVRRQDEAYTFIQPAIAIPLGPPIGVIGVPESELELFGRDTAIGEISVNQLLYVGGRRAAGMSQARSGVALARAAQAQTRRTVRAEVEQLYIQRWHAENVITVAEKTKGLMTALRSLTDALLEGGSTSLTRKDALRAALAEEKLIGIEAQVRAGFDMATRMLAQRTGQEIPPKLQDPTQLLSTYASAEANGLITQHPQLEQLRLAADIAGAQADEARGARLPVVRLSAGFQTFDNNLGAGLDNSSNQESWRIGIEIRVPIFDGGSARARVSRALSERRGREEQRAYAIDALQAQYEALRAAIARQQSQLDATQRAVTLARQLESLTRRSAGQDQEAIQEQIETTVYLALAEVDHLNAKRDYLLALSGMQSLLGTP